jgi:FlaA1/EpsC-like NDP-sugar epimerase
MAERNSAEATTVHPRLVGTKIADFEKPLYLSVLKDRVALVTGGVAGIGFGIVKALVQAGAWVAVYDLNEEAGKKVEAELTGEGYKYVLVLSVHVLFSCSWAPRGLTSRLG